MAANMHSELEYKFKVWLETPQGKLCLIKQSKEALRVAFYAGSFAHEEIARELGEKFLNARKEIENG